MFSGLFGRGVPDTEEQNVPQAVFHHMAADSQRTEKQDSVEFPSIGPWPGMGAVDGHFPIIHPCFIKKLRQHLAALLPAEEQKFLLRMVFNDIRGQLGGIVTTFDQLQPMGSQKCGGPLSHTEDPIWG